jgi:hypothetical protein
MITAGCIYDSFGLAIQKQSRVGGSYIWMVESMAIFDLLQECMWKNKTIFHYIICNFIYIYTTRDRM